MKFRTWFLLKLALKNIRLNWRHSLATSLAIMFGFSAVCLFDGFMRWLNDYNFDRYVNKGMVGHVIIEKKGAKDHMVEDPWLYSLNPAEQTSVANILKSDGRVKSFMRYLLITGLISNGKNNSLFIGAGIDEEAGLDFRGERWKWNTIAGKPLYQTKEDGILLGTGLAHRMDCQFDDDPKTNADGTYVAKEWPLHCDQESFQLSVTTEHSQVNAMSLKLVGIMDMQLREFNDRVTIMRLALAQQLMDTDRITRIDILLTDPSLIPEFVSSTTEKAKAAGLDVEVVPWLDHPVAAVARGGTEILGVFRSLFLSIVAIIAAMSIANSMMKSINERVREIGTMRSFGFRRLDIRLLFSFEGLLLGFFSCAAGVIMSWLLALLVQKLGITINPGVLSTPIVITVTVPVITWALTALFLSLITFIASWTVSRRASQMVIADALRYVG